MLKKYRSQDKQFVLTNSRGGKLLTETIHEGKRRKSDNIRTEFARVVRDLKWPRTKSLKHLRKTAASKLGEHPEYSRFAQHFLGHSPRTVADKHYVKPSQEQFDAAIAWLGEQFIHREKSARTKKARITQ